MRNKYFTNGETRLQIEPIDKRGKKIRLTIFEITSYGTMRETFKRDLDSKILSIIDFVRHVKIRKA